MVTSIEWVQGPNGERGATWNPIRGCSRISPGCGGGGSFSGTDGQRGGCYAEAIAARFSGPGQPFHGFAEMTPEGPRWTRKVALIPELLGIPLRRRKPTTWFISMSDLFHETLTNEEIAAVFGVMAAARRHTFQVLTKRSERMRDWFKLTSRIGGGPQPGPVSNCLNEAGRRFGSWNYEIPHAGPGKRIYEMMFMIHSPPDPPPYIPWPLPNVWLGCSVESTKYKTRIDDLRACPAAVRFLSLEPLLEPLGELDLTGIDQCIVGAESGHGARPMFDDWVREIRDQCVAQGVAFFFKQKLDGRGHKVSLPMLDGRSWAEMPKRALPVVQP